VWFDPLPTAALCGDTPSNVSASTVNYRSSNLVDEQGRAEFLDWIHEFEVSYEQNFLASAYSFV